MSKPMLRLISLVVCVLFLHACGSDPKSPWGFRLPDGNAVKGQALFVELQCNACHTIAGLELAAPAQREPAMTTPTRP